MDLAPVRLDENVREMKQESCLIGDGGAPALPPFLIFQLSPETISLYAKDHFELQITSWLLFVVVQKLYLLVFLN